MHAFSGLGLTVASLVVAILVACANEPTALQSRLFEMCSTTWKMGFGFVVGLLGGKTVS